MMISDFAIKRPIVTITVMLALVVLTGLRDRDPRPHASRRPLDAAAAMAARNDYRGAAVIMSACYDHALAIADDDATIARWFEQRESA